MLPDWTPFAVEPGRKRVAIVGFSSSSRDDAPWQDPAWELWGMNQGYAFFERRPDRWLEIHTAEFRPDPAVPDYLDDLKHLGCPLYMIERTAAFPTSVTYPLQRVTEGLPSCYQRYFTSTGAYAIALAIAEGFETIALYGIDCGTDAEYALQRPCIEAWLSLAAGRGIEVIVPKTSSLFKTPFVYGYEPPRAYPRVLRASEQFLRTRITGFQQQHNELLERLHKFEGAIEELTTLLNFAESAGRGATFPIAEGPS